MLHAFTRWSKMTDGLMRSFGLMLCVKPLMVTVSLRVEAMRGGREERAEEGNSGALLSTKEE